MEDRNRIKLYMFKSLCNKILFFILLNVGFVFAQDSFYKNGAVASAHQLATDVGLRVLQEGGNAVDAAVATAFVLSVVEPYASGIGGGGFMTIKMNGRPAITIDYRETAPGSAIPEKYYSKENNYKSEANYGVISIGVPGVLAGLDSALTKYGTMKLSRVLKPAIEIARGGYVVSQTMYDLIMEKYDLLSEYKETGKIYLNEGMSPEVGDRISNPDLAETYEKISAEGINTFYNGELAASLIDEINNLGGDFKPDDLKNYKAIIKNPVIGNYKGYEIISSAPPSGGGTHLVELMNILENYDLKKLGHNSAEYIKVMAEAIRMVNDEKSEYMADPDFYDIPVEELISKEHAEELKVIIDSLIAGNDSSKGPTSNESGSTTHISAADRFGNMVSLTQSINLFFGSGITVKGTGILLNDHLGNFDNRPQGKNSAEPGKRPVSSIAPTIILKDGKPFLTFGTPGGSRIIGTTAQVLVNIIDFEMNLTEAVEAARIHPTKTKLHLEGRISEDIIKKLEANGCSIEKHKEFDKYFGGTNAVMILENGEFIGASDSRRGGSAKGY